MNEPVYETIYSTNEDRYTFESVGKKGIILKVVKFVEISNNIYNFGFGDFDPITNKIDDKVVSDNGDLVKVMATIISIASVFLNHNPMAYIYFKGSNLIRTQLYQRIINRYYDSLIQSYEIYGLIDDEPEIFQTNKSYESFLIRKLI